MKSKVLIAVICSLLVSGCGTYTGTDGRTHTGDPEMCNHAYPEACLLMVSAALFGCALVVANSNR